jgi:HNH endonuclease
VVARAGNRCEYCGLSQLGQEATFHIDHVTPRAAGGQTVLDNLALACVSCSLRKGAKRTGIDPETGLPERLFDPRRGIWSEHFRWRDEWVIPTSAVGRTTSSALDLNRPLILAIRLEEILRGRHPPPG